MMTGGGSRWFRIVQEHDVRRIRRNVLVAVYLPLIAGIVIFGMFSLSSPAGAPVENAELGGMSGGGGGDQKTYEMEFGSTAGEDATATESSEKSVEIQLLRIRIISPFAPVTKPTAKPKTRETRKKQLASIAGPPPMRRLRGMGPGSGGGTGGGSGGGIGAGIGYSIDWGGTGSRRLLSGRLPKYPAGTDAEMPITVSFTVLADGTISTVVPTRRGNEILEREALSAVRTWRFETLPEAMSGKTQTGSVIFNFTLDNSTPGRQ